MRLAAIILLLVFPFGQLLRINLGNAVTLHVNDILVGILGYIGLIRFIKKPHVLKKPILFWVLAMVISLILNLEHYSNSQIFVSVLYLFRWIAFAGLFFFFINFKEKILLKKGLSVGILIVAIAGILQYLLMPDVTFLAASDWDNHYFRLVSTFLDPGFTGAVLTLGLIINYRLSYIILTALFLTYSRASYLMYLMEFAALAFYKKSIKLFLITALVLFLGIYFLPVSTGEGTKLTRETSTFARFENWLQTIKVWQASPIFGVGFNAYRYATNAPVESHAGAGADSSFLFVLATTGIVGLLAYLNLFKNVWQFAGKNTLFKVSLVAVFVHSWFNNTLFYPWIMEYLWLLLVFDS